MSARDYFKEALDALDFRAHVRGLCNTSRAFYETDRDTLRKVFGTYFEVANAAIEAGGDPATIRSLSGKELVKLVSPKGQV